VGAVRKYLSGQGASEYLIILAVVLVVALVAIALLGAFPALGGDARLTETRQYWNSQHPFAIIGYNQVGANMTLTLKNTDANLLTITNVTVGNITGNFPSGLMFNGGATKTISLTDFRNCSAGDYDFFTYNVVIYYNTSYLSNSFIGSKPLVGTCNIQ
jgi:hypothetical protein